MRPRRRTTPDRPQFDEESQNTAKDQPEPVFRPLPRLCPVEKQGALYALRMIEGARLHSRMIGNDGSIRVHELLTLVGLETDAGHSGLTPTMLARAFAAQRNRLESRTASKIRGLDENIATLGKALRLHRTECAVLHLAVIVDRIRQFSDLFGLFVATPSKFFDMVRLATGERLSRVEQALASDCNLRRAGLLCTFELDHHTNPLSLIGDIASRLLSPRFEVNSILRRLVRDSAPAALALADFSHLPESTLIQRYLEAALNQQRTGVNVLIHGAPGTGKTEFVRALAAGLDAQLCEVPVEQGNGEAITGRARFQAFALAQRLLARERKQLLLFDEVEDVFGSGDSSFPLALMGRHRRDPESLAKAWINETLESNPVPTLWVCNDIGAMDGAYLRRFDLVAEFRAPTASVRQRLVERYFQGDTLSSQGVRALASFDPLPPSQVERAARVVRALASPLVEQRDQEARQVLANSLRAMGHGATPRTTALPSHYDPALLNTAHDLTALIEGLRAGRPARLCLYGPPGTGKTALGYHLAQTLERPLHVKRASDLLSKFVGGTEKNLADAFRAASDEAAVLLIDEVDSFLHDRGRAQRSWEVSSVNEMLTQMETFEGIFIASTNHVEALDVASLRRFDFKVRFDYLDRDRRLALFQRVLPGLKFGDRERHRIERLDRLVPGDMANALRQLDVMGQAPSAVHLLDLVEAELRLKPGAVRNSIGFVH